MGRAVTTRARQENETKIVNVIMLVVLRGAGDAVKNTERDEKETRGRIRTCACVDQRGEAKRDNVMASRLPSPADHGGPGPNQLRASTSSPSFAVCLTVLKLSIEHPTSVFDSRIYLFWLPICSENT
jgi:hypothetical protein